MKSNFNGNRRRGNRRGNMRGSQQRSAEPGMNSGIPLSEAPLGTPLRVTGISGGYRSQARLAALGILPGEQVEIVQRDNGGPILLDVKGTRVALGRGISLKVLVSV